MAKVKYTNRLGPYGELSDLYTDLFHIDITETTKTKAVCEDTGTGNKLILLGSKFTYDEFGMTGGTITSIVFETENEKRIAVVNHGRWDPQDFITAYGTDGFDGMVAFVLRGKDTMIGSKLGDLLAGETAADKILGGKGRDLIYGEEGNDRLTGGPGSDTFFFQPGSGKDVITDFDAVGGELNELKQDYLNLPFDTEYTETPKGKNLFLDFGDGDTLTLLGVKAKDFGDEDIRSLV